MSGALFIDAHVHTGLPGVFFAPESSLQALLAGMDRLGMRYAICTDQLSVTEGAAAGLAGLRRAFAQSEGRVYYLGVFDPRDPEACLRALDRAVRWPGFVGLKIHPSFHGRAADDPSYERAWRFAAEHDVAILTHSWSLSDYNPVQRHSTPERFEKFIERFSGVRLVLGHAGGRGLGRHEAVRLARTYPNVFVDFAGDIFCYRLIETLVRQVPVRKILFGSDFPWLDPRANLSRVLLAGISVDAKRMILFENAARVYKIGMAR